MDSVVTKRRLSSGPVMFILKPANRSSANDYTVLENALGNQSTCKGIQVLGFIDLLCLWERCPF